MNTQGIKMKYPEIQGAKNKPSLFGQINKSDTFKFHY